MLKRDATQIPEQSIFDATVIAKKRYESRPHIMELLLDGNLKGEVRTAELRNSNRLANVLSEKTRAFRKLDQDLSEEFQITITMLDAIWSISYRRDNVINDVYLQESLKASICYMETYLVKYLSRVSH